MTVLLSLLTQEGIVFSADSRETFNQGGRLLIRDGAQKIFPLGDHILYGASGEIGMVQRVTEVLQKEFKGGHGIFNQPIESLKIRLRNWIFPILKDTADHAIRVSGYPEPVLQTIICGRTDNRHWIIEIEPRGNVEECTHRGFCAAGSGGLTGQFAVQCLAHLQIETRKLYQGKVVAYRIVDDVIRSGDPLVGGDVQMYVITPTGIQQIQGPDMQETRNMVVIWKEIEKDSLGKLKEPSENA